MPRKLLHAILTGATFLVVWLVASPASALPSRAPVCDPRGAIGFAPPPQIQDPEQSLDVPPDCFDANVFEGEHATPGRPAPLDISSSDEPVAIASLVPLGLTFEERRAPSSDVESSPPAGVRRSVDRPPRA